LNGPGDKWHFVPDAWVTLFAIFRLEVWSPKKESSVMEERLRFITQLLDGEAMTDVCRQFGISRKTGCKIFNRGLSHIHQSHIY
jgi:hypothetical protein